MSLMGSFVASLCVACVHPSTRPLTDEPNESGSSAHEAEATTGGPAPMTVRWFDADALVLRDLVVFAAASLQAALDVIAEKGTTILVVPRAALDLILDPDRRRWRNVGRLAASVQIVDESALCAIARQDAA